jgi:hypothetical protein
MGIDIREKVRELVREHGASETARRLRMPRSTIMSIAAGSPDTREGSLIPAGPSTAHGLDPGSGISSDAIAQSEAQHPAALTPDAAIERRPERPIRTVARASVAHHPWPHWRKKLLNSGSKPRPRTGYVSQFSKTWPVKPRAGRTMVLGARPSRGRWGRRSSSHAAGSPARFGAPTMSDLSRSHPRALARQAVRQLFGAALFARQPSAADDVHGADRGDHEDERQHAKDRVVWAHHVLRVRSSTPPSTKLSSARPKTLAVHPAGGPRSNIYRSKSPKTRTRTPASRRASALISAQLLGASAIAPTPTTPRRRGGQPWL